MNKKNIIKNILIIKNNIINYIKKYNFFSKRNLFILISGIILLILYILFGRTSVLFDKFYIKRDQLGKPDKDVTLYINNDADINNLEIRFKINSLRLDIATADKKFDEMYEFILTDCLGNNKDFENIVENLNFQNKYENINAIWSFEPTTDNNSDYIEYYNKYNRVIDSMGNVNNKNFVENEIVTGNIIVQFNTQVKEMETDYKSKKYVIPVIVKCPILNKTLEIKNEILKQIEINNINNQNEEYVELPNNINNENLIYTEKFDWTIVFIPIFTVFIIFIFNYNDKFKENEIKQKIQRKLEIDYPQIVTKTLIYINSGMTIRNTLICIANNYINKSHFKDFEKRKAYEELVIFKNKMNNGYNEISALDDISKNINDRNYTRFLNILIQGIRNGSKDLKNILNMEVSDALFSRKMNAKKLGEEASTKLILPLLMMFFIILVVIIVPAFTNI